MKEKIKILRLKIDALAQMSYILLTSQSNTSIGSHLIKAAVADITNLKSCRQSLLLSKAWLGKTLGLIGEETPYKNDGNRKLVSDIEPTSDKSKNVFRDDLEKLDFETGNYIEKIDFLRERIKNTSYDLDIVMQDSDAKFNKISAHLLLSYQHICEARFHLGYELEAIREKSTISQTLDTHG